MRADSLPETVALVRMRIPWLSATTTAKRKMFAAKVIEVVHLAMPTRFCVLPNILQDLDDTNTHNCRMFGQYGPRDSLCFEHSQNPRQA